MVSFIFGFLTRVTLLCCKVLDCNIVDWVGTGVLPGTKDTLIDMFSCYLVEVVCSDYYFFCYCVFNFAKRTRQIIFASGLLGRATYCLVKLCVGAVFNLVSYHQN